MRADTQDRAFLSYLSLFSSVGTLLCCALPSLLVLAGLGATGVHSFGYPVARDPFPSEALGVCHLRDPDGWEFYLRVCFGAEAPDAGRRVFRGCAGGVRYGQQTQQGSALA